MIIDNILKYSSQDIVKLNDNTGLMSCCLDIFRPLLRRNKIDLHSRQVSASLQHPLPRYAKIAKELVRHSTMDS